MRELKVECKFMSVSLLAVVENNDDNLSHLVVYLNIRKDVL